MRSPDSKRGPPRQPSMSPYENGHPYESRSADCAALESARGAGADSTARARSRTVTQKSQERSMWPNPWMRHSWDPENPLDLNKPPQEDSLGALGESAFKPAFTMDLNDLVLSLWTPPKAPPPSPSLRPQDSARSARATPAMRRQRSGSPPPPQPSLPTHTVPSSVRGVRRHVARQDEYDSWTTRALSRPIHKPVEAQLAHEADPRARRATGAWMEGEEPRARREMDTPPTRYEDDEPRSRRQPQPYNPRIVRDMYTPVQPEPYEPVDLRLAHEADPRIRRATGAWMEGEEPRARRERDTSSTQYEDDEPRSRRQPQSFDPRMVRDTYTPVQHEPPRSRRAAPREYDHRSRRAAQPQYEDYGPRNYDGHQDRLYADDRDRRGRPRMADDDDLRGQRLDPRMADLYGESSRRTDPCFAVREQEATTTTTRYRDDGDSRRLGERPRIDTRMEPRTDHRGERSLRRMDSDPRSRRHEPCSAAHEPRYERDHARVLVAPRQLPFLSPHPAAAAPPRMAPLSRPAITRNRSGDDDEIEF